MKAVADTLAKLKMPCPLLTDGTCPVDIPGLDSQTWPFMMDQLTDLLEITIPDNANIFFKKASVGHRARKLTITEIVDVLIELARRPANS